MPLIRKDAAPGPADTVSTDHHRGLGEGSTEQRWAAARALTAAGDVPLLAQALARESDPKVREALLTSLARAGTSESLDAVMPLLRSDDASARTAALDALRAMPVIVAARLQDLLNDQDPDVRLLACELARAIPAPQAASLLAERLGRDPEPNVCAAAVEVLAEVGGPDALAELDACAKRFPHEPFLAFATRAAADRIRNEAPARRG